MQKTTPFPAADAVQPLGAAVGASDHEGSRDAGRAAAAEAMRALGGRRPSLAVVFASSDHDHHALLAGVTEIVGDVPLVGGSGEGVIAGSASNEAFSAVAVMLVAGDRLRFETCLVDDYAHDPAGAGARLAAWANTHRDDARCLCVLPDGLTGHCTAMLAALHAELARPLPVVGGTTADAFAFESTFQFAAGRVASGGLAAVLICGEVDVEVAVSHGCLPVGLSREVTSASGGWIREIDGQPAWHVFKEYLAEDARDLNADGIVHLALGERLHDGAEGYDPYVIRIPLQLDKASGALFFPGGGLTEGTTVVMMRRDADKIRQSARDCAVHVLASHQGRAPDLVLQFDCAGRGRILWGACAADEIVAPLREILGSAVPWIGVHTYGEIAPIAGRPYYHNYTVALCALYEREP